MALLLGADIQLALNRTRKPVELRDFAGVRIQLSEALEVSDYLARGYEAHGTKRRVRYLCPSGRYVDRRTFDVDCSFWDGRGCLHFWKDQRTAA